MGASWEMPRRDTGPEVSRTAAREEVVGIFWPEIDHISKRKHDLVEYDRRVVECRRVRGAGAAHCRVWCEPGAEAS